jgi:trimeric autotransporter adhesin
LTSLGHNFSNDTTMSVLLNNESDVVGGTLTGTNLIYLGNNSNSNNFGNIQVGASNDNVINTSSGDLTIDSASGVTRVDDNLIVAGDINVNSDARLKANIISLGFTLGKLLQVDGKTYTFKDDKNHNSKIGLLAQDIEKVFPELVTETNGIKSVNYQGLIPVLINALKEQDEKMNDQQSQINKLENLVHELIN